MESFFDRVSSRWPAGRPDLHWHLLPPAGQTQKALVEQYRDLTHRAGLAPVAAQWLHVTVLHSAPAADVSETELERLVDVMRQRCASIAPVTVTLFPPAVGSVALECPGRPGEPARRVWQAAVDSNREVLGDRVTGPLEFYQPHASLAYCDQPGVNGAPLKVWLSDHEIEPYAFTADTVALVSQRHDGHYITWEHLLEVPLGG